MYPIVLKFCHMVAKGKSNNFHLFYCVEIWIKSNKNFLFYGIFLKKWTNNCEQFHPYVYIYIYKCLFPFLSICLFIFYSDRSVNTKKKIYFELVSNKLHLTSSIPEYWRTYFAMELSCSPDWCTVESVNEQIYCTTNNVY